MAVVFRPQSRQPLPEHVTVFPAAIAAGPSMAVNPAMSEAEEFKVHCRAADGEAVVELSDTFRETRPAVETELTDNDNEFDWAAQVLTKQMVVPTTNIRYRKTR